MIVDTSQHGHDLKPGTATTRSSTPLSPLEPASLSTYTRSTWYTYPYKILGRSPVDLLSLCCAEAQSYPIPRFLISRSPATTRNPLATMERDVHLPRSHPHAPDDVMGRLNTTRRRGHEAPPKGARVQKQIETEFTQKSTHRPKGPTWSPRSTGESPRLRHMILSDLLP